ncbi:MAG: 5-formyltetrahydrofolate cyclo-ligase [Proteobacteria bacterium]|nr:5-formyltetrahydrofolate cyclo-ligase [Pseudomonadota bacterium]
MRDAMSPASRAAAADRIQDAVLAHPAFTSAGVVMAYSTFGSELDTSRILAAVRERGATLVLPRIDRQRDALALHAVDDLAHDLVPNRWGIREPRPEGCRLVHAADLQFVLVPGVAFDPHGRRLGYGKGYYDRLLRRSIAEGGTPYTVAGAFDLQVVNAVPIEAHDFGIMEIVSESRGIGCTVQSGSVTRG